MDIKEVVKEKYGQAALRVHTGGSSCCGSAASSQCGADPITHNLYAAGETGALPQGPSWPHWAAAIPRRWRSSIPARPCSTLAQAAASTCCSRPNASGPREELTGST